MAEQIKLSVEADKKAIFVYGATGSYDVECNPGGWGTPNLKHTDIDEATVEVFPPESETGIIIDVSDALPNECGMGYEIIAEDLGLTEITSGVWKFVYRVKSTQNNFEQTVTVSKYFDELIACCVDSMVLNICQGDLLSECSKKRIEMQMLLENARWAACVGDLKGAQTIANHISLKCKCCK